MIKLRNILILSTLLVALVACKISYSFTGTSIQADVQTVTIQYFEYKALQVNPSLANDLTEGLKEKFRRLTKIEQVDEDGDLIIYGEIVGYDVRASAISTEEVAAQNRLTISVKISFTNNKYPNDNFDKSFSAYADFDGALSLDAVEAGLCEEINEKLIDDIFNATVANW